jgi:hypothetical protein
MVRCAANIPQCETRFLPVENPEMGEPKQSFRGNKSALPSKPCLACGRPMSWRKAWAKNWDEVKYCSQRCRSDKAKPTGQ